ncbi:MAG TPA: glycosyltransferase [Terriglobales bacterium]|jgi:glycosyltransferase involved in cell wall biosynthesis|nr:glycosyltransferase [Terriglobales bacterium]
MRLDVILPTFNRHELLKRTLESLLAADTPTGLSVTVTVVDNNSSDATRETVESYHAKFSGRLRYVFEKKQGRSQALNAGINSTSGDLIGMIDDDEQIDRQWFRRIYEMFAGGEVDFIGGPYVPHWPGTPPSWLPRDHAGVIGVVNGGPLHAYGTSDAELMGGNAVISRAMLTKVGLYSTDLGRNGKRPLADEDTDMYHRLLSAGARGMYVPDLIIYHYIHPDRLTKRYFRRWHFWRGVSSGVLDHRQPQPTPYLLGVPRYLFGSAARGFLHMLPRMAGLRKDPAELFGNELKVFDLFGFFYGKHFYKPSNT